MDKLRVDTEFLIVEFDEKDENNSPLIDLVPRSWTSEITGKMFSRYPKNYSKVKKYVQNKKIPNIDWKNYSIVKVIAEARNHEQGERRLKRAIKDLNVILSTDVESEIIETFPSSQPDRLSQQEVSSYLDTALSMPIIQDKYDSNLTSLSNNIIIEDLTNESQNIRKEYNGIDTLKQHIDEKFHNFEICLTRKIESAKRSILYDLEKKIDEVKNNLILSPTASMKQSLDARKKIDVNLPITILEDFFQFDETLNDIEKRDALKILMKSVISGSTSLQKDVTRIIPMIISKPVQLQYSACGRQTNRTGKLNFSATQTFACLKEILQDKYAESTEPLPTLISCVSRWLAGAGDREGGRRSRTNNNS